MGERTARALLVLSDAAAGLDWVHSRARDAAGVVVCDPAGIEFGTIASVSNVPVLTPVVPGTAAEDVSERLLRALTEALRTELRDAGQYADLTARSLTDGTGPGRLLAWVARRHDAAVTVHDGLHEEEWPEEVRGARAVEQIRRLVRGQTTAPVRLTTPAGKHVQVRPVGAVTPRRVLVASRGRPWSAQGQLTLDQVAMITEGLLREETITARAAQTRTATIRARTSAFQFLMVGDFFTAERTVEPLAPGLVGAKSFQVAVAETAPGETRDALAAEVEAALGEARALPVLCPVEDGQVIVLWDETQGPVQDVLRPVAQGVAGRAVGVSAVGPLDRAPVLYETAAVSIEAARRVPTRVAVADGRPPVATLLDPSARAWARQLLAPVELALPRAVERQQVLTVCRAALALGAAGAAKATGQHHRQTIAAKLADVMTLTCLDRHELTHRMALDLALRLADLPAPAPGTVPAAGMVEALDHEGARVWGQTVLAGLPPRLLTALAAWVRRGLNIQEAARELGVSRNTLSEYLREASGYVHLRLGRDRPGPAHELFWALHVTGRVRIALPDGEIGGQPAHLTSEARRGPGMVPSERAPQMPTEIRTDVPHPARLYDYFLGGRTNFTADREAAAAVLKRTPYVPDAARLNREFMHRAVRWLATEGGIRQFLDVGTGIPTEPNLHQVAQGEAPTARVVYVDNDPIVLHHAEALLTSHAHGATAYLQADAHDPDSILSAGIVRTTLDLSQPVALSLVALLHFVDDDETAQRIVTTLTGGLAPGSYLVLAHGTPDFDPGPMRAIMDQYRERGIALRYRTRDEVLALLAGLDLVEPGLAAVHRWRAEHREDELAAHDTHAGSYGVVARV